MKNHALLEVIAVFAIGLLCAHPAKATTQTISSSSSGGGTNFGTATVNTASVVTCTYAAGGTYGTSCYINAPGWGGVVNVGQSIGTSGAGTVTLSCYGQYPVNGGLNCTAKIDDELCTPEQTIHASASGSGSTSGLAPIKSPALVECTQAVGGTYGTQCYIQSPGWNGYLSAGQSTATSGAGTVYLGCSGQTSPSGGLLCSAQVSQVCP